MICPIEVAVIGQDSRNGHVVQSPTNAERTKETATVILIAQMILNVGLKTVWDPTFIHWPIVASVPLHQIHHGLKSHLKILRRKTKKKEIFIIIQPMLHHTKLRNHILILNLLQPSSLQVIMRYFINFLPCFILFSYKSGFLRKSPKFDDIS